jgi:hypothetical protein
MVCHRVPCYLQLFITTLFVSSLDPTVVCDGLQQQLNSLTDYFKRWKKNEFVENPGYLPIFGIVLDGEEIPWTLDKRLTLASHTTKLIERAERAFHILYSFLNRKSKLCLHNKLLLYTSCFRPILCYGVKIWYNCATMHKKNLQIIQNKCLKNRHWRYSTFDLHQEWKIYVALQVLWLRTH